jgi:hypothetical protein
MAKRLGVLKNFIGGLSYLVNFYWSSLAIYYSTIPTLFCGKQTAGFRKLCINAISQQIKLEVSRTENQSSQHELAIRITLLVLKKNFIGRSNIKLKSKFYLFR